MGKRLSPGDEKVVSSQRKKKTSRKIALGWLNKTKNQTFRQIKTAAGGGRREISVDLETKCSDILKKCIELFFPRGESDKGNISLFDVELQDYKHNKCTDLEMTVGQIYEITGLNILRFYLATSPKCEEVINDVDDDFIPETVVNRQLTSTGSHLRRSTRISSNSSFTSQQQLNGTLFDSDVDDNFPVYLEDNSASLYFATFDENEYGDNSNSDAAVAISQLQDLPNWPSITNMQQESDQTIVETLVLHRGNVFKELIEAFKVRDIDFKSVRIEMILPNGRPEIAEDMGGVLRDCITEFFNSFYEMCTMGADCKVPCLRHDFQKEEWGAIGKIITESFLSVRYFPIKISPIFFKDCLGVHADNEEEILENFLKYVSNSDSKLLQNALKNFEENDLDDLIEFCNNYDAKWIPTRENFRKMLLQIAHEELIQKPSFIKDCFSSHLLVIRDDIDIANIYSKFKASDKNILSLLKTDETLPSEKKKIIGYLKKYIKESDHKTRSAFLRFCTGSDLANREIKVDFNESIGFSRTPIAHTCSGLLELPTSYENFMLFRSEFNQLLNSSIWVMDII